MSETLPLKPTDDRMIAAMRLVLASSALLIIYLHPSEPDRYVALTYAALVFYTAYSVACYALLRRLNLSLPAKIPYWVDVGWYVVLISLSSGTNSVFFLFFFFAILVASFGEGFTSGLRVVLVSTILFTTFGWAAAPAGPSFDKLGVVNRLELALYAHRHGLAKPLP